MIIVRCIPEFVVRDVAGIASFLVDIVGFEYDDRTFDDADASSQAILALGDIELRLYASLDRKGDCSLVFQCRDCAYWRDILEQNGFHPSFNQDIGEPVTVECRITDECRVTFEEESKGS